MSLRVKKLIACSRSSRREARQCFVPRCHRHTLQTSAGVQWWLAAEVWYFTWRQEWHSHYFYRNTRRCHHLIDMLSEDQLLESTRKKNVKKKDGQQILKKIGHSSQFICKVNHDLVNLWVLQQEVQYSPHDQKQDKAQV